MNLNKKNKSQMTQRIKLRETPEFANAKKRLQDKMLDLNQDPKLLDNNIIIEQKVDQINELKHEN